METDVEQSVDEMVLVNYNADKLYLYFHRQEKSVRRDIPPIGAGKIIRYIV